MGGSDYQSERRPIASRNNRLSKWAANRLASRNVSPNMISTGGMIAGMLAGAAFASTQAFPDMAWLSFLVAALMMQLRLVANMLDGMVALQTRKDSAVGELFNEIPDRVSDSFAIVGAGYAMSSSVELGFVAALLAVFLAYIRAQGRVAGAHQEFCGPMAKQHRMFLLTVLALVGAFAPTAWVEFQIPITGWGLIAIGLSAMIVGELITIGRRLTKISKALKESA